MLPSSKLAADFDDLQIFEDFSIRAATASDQGEQPDRLLFLFRVIPVTLA